MVEQVTQINLFYPLLFVVLIVLIIAICSVIKSRNGNMTFKDMFCLSSNNSKEIMIDTTDKMKDMHSEVVHILPDTYEKELHKMNTDIKSNTDRIERIERIVQELNDKFDIIISRVAKLEKNN